MNRIPDYLKSSENINASKKNLLAFDNLMTEAICDQRIADLFTKGSYHRDISVVYLIRNLFPQGKVCRDIALNTEYHLGPPRHKKMYYFPLGLMNYIFPD